MRFTTSITTLLALAASALAAPVELETRDVWDPKVLYPNSHTVWHAGETHTVVWNTTNPPKLVSNGAAIYLRQTNKFYGDSPLAEGFDLHSGRQTITLPKNLTTGSDYRIVLFGDSGNWSPKFKIEGKN
jgi:hypothetical protein